MRSPRRAARKPPSPASPRRSMRSSPRPAWSTIRIARSTGSQRYPRTCSSPSVSGRDRAMRFQDAASDTRAIVYAGIQADPLVARAAALLADASHEQRVLARAVMNGMSTSAPTWRAMFPTLFGPDVAAGTDRDRSEAILVASLQVAERGEQVRSQVRGAIVESLTEMLVRRRPGLTAPAAVRRERRILFDGVRAEIHPYD